MDGVILAVLTFLGVGAAAHAATAESATDGTPNWRLLAGLALGGAVLALGKLLASKESFSWRLAIGRAIIGGGLAVGASALLIMIPGLSPMALAGCAAVAAILGEQAVEKIINARAGIDGK